MTLNIIFAVQEYILANHKDLWLQMSKEKKDEHFLIINIPADQIVSRIKKKKYRIEESKKGLIKLCSNLFIIRPIFFIRPEITIGLFYKVIAKKICKILDSALGIDKYNRINVISYNPLWIKILKPFKPNFFYFYYLYDEVRLEASSGKLNRKRAKLDFYACKEANMVFSISQSLTLSRQNNCKRIITVGNGCSIKSTNNLVHYKNSFAFVGVFRSWIDKQLLIDIVKNCKRYTFYIVGVIENDMKCFFDDLMKLKNVKYLGSFCKDEMKNIYGMFDSIIVPYVQNNFIYKTRPIKIVESIFCGTPVITIPISGYNECSFLKFAKNKTDFIKYIRYFSNYSINTNSIEYKKFVNENSWKYIAKKILMEMEKSK